MIAKLILSISKSNATLVKNIKYSIVFGIVENISNKSSLLTLFKSLIKSIAIDLFFNSLYLEENVNNFVKLVQKDLDQYLNLLTFKTWTNYVYYWAFIMVDKIKWNKFIKKIQILTAGVCVLWFSPSCSKLNIVGSDSNIRVYNENK